MNNLRSIIPRSVTRGGPTRGRLYASGARSRARPALHRGRGIYADTHTPGMLPRQCERRTKFVGNLGYFSGKFRVNSARILDCTWNDPWFGKNKKGELKELHRKCRGALA